MKTGIVIAEQKNGELIRVERWVYEDWIRGLLRDSVLAGPLESAVEIRSPKWCELFNNKERTK